MPFVMYKYFGVVLPLGAAIPVISMHRSNPRMPSKELQELPPKVENMN